MSYIASEKTINFINILLAEREVPASTRAYVETLIAEGITQSRASDAITHLKSLPKAGLFDAPAEVGTPVAAEGFFLYEGDVYRVVLGKTSGNLYAKKSTASGWDYESGKGKMRVLREEHRMTPDAIAEFGVQHQFCVVCSSAFEDPTSHHIGIGPTCGPRLMGKEAYKALRLSVADRPDVVLYEAARKAREKARREERKREADQLALV